MSDAIDTFLEGTQTPIFGFNKPLVGGDWNEWGDETNANWDLLDGALLPIWGGTMTGLLMLSGDPVAPLGAATKQYAESAAASAAALAVPLAGGTMTGPLLLSGDPTTARQATTKSYVDGLLALAGVVSFNTRVGIVTLTAADVSGASGLLTTGGAMSGVLTLASDPISALHAATKQYVDHTASTVAAAYLPLTGGTLSGPLSVADQLGVTGQITCGSNVQGQQIVSLGAVYINHTATPAWQLYSDGATEFHQWQTGWWDGWTISSGLRTWYGNGKSLMTLDSGGDLSATGFVAAGTNLFIDYPTATDFSIYRSAPNRVLQWAAGGWIDAWNESTGTRTWDGINFAVLMSLDGNYGNLTLAGAVVCAGTGVTYTNIGNNGFNFRWDGTHINGRVDNVVEIPFQAASDERMKGDIAPSTFDCLAAVLATPLFQFRWKDTQDLTQFETAEVPEDAPLVPIGFVAQRQYEVFPDSVTPGSEIGESVAGATTIWQMDHNTLCAALCGAVQQLAARVTTLEAQAAGRRRH